MSIVIRGLFNNPVVTKPIAGFSLAILGAGGQLQEYMPVGYSLLLMTVTQSV